MLERYPAHPLSAEACRWLCRYSSSSEAHRRDELGQFLMVTDFSNEQQMRRWHQSCAQLESRLAGFGGLYASDVAVQFCVQSRAGVPAIPNWLKNGTVISWPAMAKAARGEKLPRPSYGLKTGAVPVPSKRSCGANFAAAIPGRQA